MDEDVPDISSWLGRAPPKPVAESDSDEDIEMDDRDPTAITIDDTTVAQSDSDEDEASIDYDPNASRPTSKKPSPPPVESSEEESIPAIESDSDLALIRPKRPSRATRQVLRKKRSSYEREIDDADDEINIPVIGKQPALVVNVPVLDAEQREEYEFLPGHDTVRKVLAHAGENKFLVKLDSGDLDLVTTIQLNNELINGPTALNNFKSSRRRSGRTQAQTEIPMVDGEVQWDQLRFTSLDPILLAREGSSESQDYYDPDPSTVQHDRRPRRATRKSNPKYVAKSLADFFDDTGSPSSQRRGSRKGHTRSQRASKTSRKVSQFAAELSSDDDVDKRRSERTKAKPKKSMREKQEDEFSSQSEKETTQRLLTTKEIFQKLPENEPFRKRHQQECATCYRAGDLPDKGSLVFCQGCTSSYHKNCLGHRGSRDHLVTKVGDGLFILQCRRCIGVAREKDAQAPHYGKCTKCDKINSLSRPLKNRLTPKQEQLHREENGGIDPITIVPSGTVNNVKNVMFRCATCNRAWHMHHLPNRKTANSQPGDSDEEALQDAELAQKRFNHYHRSWLCKECVENQHQVDTIVAWRPVNVETYIPGTTSDHVPESHKEYLVKWKNQSYLRCTWAPGTWIWGIAAASSRVAFNRRAETQLPRMTTKDAIPEEYYRVDIVFDVRYTSVVRNSSEQIDYVRVKEVDSAYVKYKGLGFEDAIWEKPPHYTETERWQDFKIAYEDFVKKQYMSLPQQRTLRRRLADVRTQDFGTKLIKKEQAKILTGGQIMQYQLEGHNWLYYQWYRQHNAILADEMGLGKTIQLIALFATLIQDHKCWPFLIVVPNSTCPNWRREIQKWVPSIRAVCYYGSAAARKLTHDYELFPKDKEKEEQPKPQKKSRSEPKDIKAHIVIASYESVVEEKTRKSLMRVPWQGLIVDEGQRLKSDKNLVYEALSKFNFPFKVLMTGTPLQNNARELFNLLQFLDRDKHNAAELEAKYAELTQENVPELHEMLKPYFLRRTKVQVLTFLPPMSQVIVPVTMSSLQKKVYKSVLAQNPQLMKSLFARDGNIPVKERTNLNNILMQLRKVLCHPFVYSRSIEDRRLDSDTMFRRLVEASSKLQLLSLMLPKLRERGHRVLIFSQFLDNLDIVEDFLDGLGMLHRRIDGNVTAMDKQRYIDEFNAPESPYFAFLLSTRAGGVGINLATADTVIILDPDFNPHQDIQALSRAHRIGQQNKVLCFQLMTRASAEEKIMQIGKKKMALDHVLIETMDQADEVGMDLESILRHGAEALFADDGTGDIIYNDASVDQLLDRSHVENTKTSDDQSAESQFSFARIWANDKATMEDTLEDSRDATPDPGIWDKILQERERAYAEEASRKAGELGRGKRQRGAVNYRAMGRNFRARSEDQEEGHETADDEFREVVSESSDDVVSEPETDKEILTFRRRPYKRVRVPTGDAPYFNGEGPIEMLTAQMPRKHRCMACKEEHPMGWCRLKWAGVEYCGLCAQAHLGHGRVCPHLNDEKQVETILLTLKESTEPQEVIAEAVKYLRVIRSDLVSQRRAAERRQQLELQSRQQNTMRLQGPPPPPQVYAPPQAPDSGYAPFNQQQNSFASSAQPLQFATTFQQPYSNQLYHPQSNAQYHSSPQIGTININHPRSTKTSPYEAQSEIGNNSGARNMDTGNSGRAA